MQKVMVFYMLMAVLITYIFHEMDERCKGVQIFVIIYLSFGLYYLLSLFNI